MIAFGGRYPTTVIPSTVVLDRQHRVAAVFLRELLAEDLQPVVERLASEKPARMTLDRGRPADGHRAAAAGHVGQRARRLGVVRLAVRGSAGARIPVLPGRGRRRRREPCHAWPAGSARGAAAGGGGGGAVRRRLHRGVRARHRRGAGDDDDADHQSASAAAHRRGGHDPDGPGLHRFGAGVAARHAVHPAAALHARRCPAAGRGVRAGVDAVPRPDADRRDRGGLGDRGQQRGARHRARRRLLPRAGNPLRASGFRFGTGRRGLGWLRRHTRTIQIFGGVLLILVGVALVTGLWNDFVSWVRDAFVSDVRLPI